MAQDAAEGLAEIKDGPIGQSNDSLYKSKPKARIRRPDGVEDGVKRRCVSTACIACRKRKSKCDGNTPACAACASVYRTECLYDPNSDHRRKGVYKSDADNLKTRNPTLQTLVQAIIALPEDEAFTLVRQIRTTNNLEDVAQKLREQDSMEKEEGDEDMSTSPISQPAEQHPAFETHLAGKMGELRLEDGSTRYIGGTSNLIFLGNRAESPGQLASKVGDVEPQEHPITSWSTVTTDPDLVMHLLNMYFTWHYTFFTTLSKTLFYRDFVHGHPLMDGSKEAKYCSPLLVNAMLALGCHFTALPAARENSEDSATAGDHFFKEAKRLLMATDEHEKPKLTTVQALALMSVREAGCGREAKGWVYSGMSFRMACDLGLNLDSGSLSSNSDGSLNEDEEDARSITFWGCFLFDKCWSNYLGRLPQLPRSIITVPKFDVFPNEEAELWSPYTDSGFSQARAQPSRTRAVALQISHLCEISSDLMNAFYNPIDMDKSKGKHAELKKLSELHQRLESWRRNLPAELEPKEGALASVLVMHMFFQILYIHLFRPFLKYNQTTSPLPANVSPRKLCTGAAAMISKLLRLYKRSHGLRQICNIAVYIAHSACTIHLLNLPEKNARRDIIHGFKHLEEIAEGWLCARRTLAILNVLAERWEVELPQEAATVLHRANAKFGTNPEFLRSIGSSLSPGPSTDRRKHHAEASKAQRNNDAHNHTAYDLNSMPVTSSASSSHPVTQRVSPPAQCLPNQTSANAPIFTKFQQPQPTHSADSQRPYGPVNSSMSIALDPTVSTVTSIAADAAGVPYTPVSAMPRDAQDWWLRDQSQFATGFGNWGVIDSPGHQQPAWPHGPGMHALGQQTVGNESNGVSDGGLGTGVGADNIVSASGVVGHWSPTGMNGYGRVNEYNEEVWYQ